jgi:hypothetical protein
MAVIETPVVARAQSDAGYVDWAAILAGAVVAMAISALFLAFGSAIGLSLTEIDTAANSSATWIIIAVALWLIWVQLSGLMGGSYVAGRMRRRIGDAQPSEVSVRDGMHGLLVWAVALLAGTLLTVHLAASGARGLTSLGSSAANAVAQSANGEGIASRLLRPAPTPEGAAAQPNPAPAQTGPDPMAEIARIIVANPDFNFEEDDKAYVASLIAQRTGLPAAEARTRLDETLNTLAATADRARRMGIIGAFLAAASLLVGAMASWWAATKGGDHRDQGLDHSRYALWR